MAGSHRHGRDSEKKAARGSAERPKHYPTEDAPPTCNCSTNDQADCSPRDGFVVRTGDLDTKGRLSQPAGGFEGASNMPITKAKVAKTSALPKLHTSTRDARDKGGSFQAILGACGSAL